MDDDKPARKVVYILIVFIYLLSEKILLLIPGLKSTRHRDQMNYNSIGQSNEKNKSIKVDFIELIKRKMREKKK